MPHVHFSKIFLAKWSHKEDRFPLDSQTFVVSIGLYLYSVTVAAGDHHLDERSRRWQVGRNQYKHVGLLPQSLRPGRSLCHLRRSIQTDLVLDSGSGRKLDTQHAGGKQTRTALLGLDSSEFC